jgi:hypothetical protein
MRGLRIASTELAIVLEHAGFYSPYFQIQHMFGVLAWTQRGFVLIAQSPYYTTLEPFYFDGAANQLTEYMKRVYDFGSLSDRINFNGDFDQNGNSLVNAQDLADFNTAWNKYKGNFPCNWVHGDVDQDNDVDQADMNKFMFWWNAPRPPGQQYPSAVPIHLGAADPMDALTKP